MECQITSGRSRAGHNQVVRDSCVGSKFSGEAMPMDLSVNIEARSRKVPERPRVFGAVVACGLLIIGSAHAQSDLDSQKQALELINATADRICNVVTTYGETQSSEVKG